MFEHLGAALEIDSEHSWAHYALSHLYLELPPPNPPLAEAIAPWRCLMRAGRLNWSRKNRSLSSNMLDYC